MIVLVDSALQAVHVQAMRVQAVWDVLGTVLDPEVPAVSLCDLGIVRDVIAHAGGLEIVLTPTYSGCPATEVIEQDVLAAMRMAELGPAWVTLRRAPAWTTDWISSEGRRKLTEYGIAPPAPVRAGDAQAVVFFGRQPNGQRLVCPRCSSSNTECLSTFGTTACKALYRCLACKEPFEYFKPI